MDMTLGDACARLGVRSRATLRKWLGRLEVETARHAYDWRCRMVSETDVRRIREARNSRPHTGAPAPAARRVAAAGTPADHFENRWQRARFLERHGWPVGTTRMWRDAPLGPREAVLRYALAHDEAAGYRALTRKRVVHPCKTPGCPCSDLMGSPAGVLAEARDGEG